MVLQTILRTGIFILGIALVGSADAQTVTNIGRAAQSPNVQATAPAGPTVTARRQPRPADPPSGSSPSPSAPYDQESPEDEALNRTIKGICRGC